MFRQFISKLNEKGSMMVEALAMLGLIAMVTPILYKKASERTTELQDINSASEMRALIKGVDDYLKDNYTALINGEKVIRSTTDSSKSEFNYSAFKNATDAHVTVPLAHMEEYLPYGFLDNTGQVQASKTFDNYKVVVKKVAPTGDNRKKTLTGFVFAEPVAVSEFPVLRSSRIASMIGSNGGYAYTANNATGVQGVWEVKDTNANLGVSAAQGTVVAASVQPISASAAGDLEDVLYRKWRMDQKYNTMETTLYMGRHRVEDINQMIVVADSPSTGDWHNDTIDADSALLIENGGGATIAGRVMAAGEKFLVNTDQLRYGVVAADGDPGSILDVDDTQVKVGVDKTMIDVDTGNYESRGEMIVDGNSLFGVDGDKGSGKYTDGTGEYKLTVRGNMFVDGILRVTKLVADEVNASILRAGSDINDVEDDDEKKFALYAEQDRIHAGKTYDSNDFPLEINSSGSDRSIRNYLGTTGSSFFIDDTIDNRFEVSDQFTYLGTMSSDTVAGAAISQEIGAANSPEMLLTTYKAGYSGLGYRQDIELDGSDSSLRLSNTYGPTAAEVNRISIVDEGINVDLEGEDTKNIEIIRSGVSTSGEHEVFVQDDINFRVLQANSGIFHIASNPTTTDRNSFYSQAADGKSSKGSVYITQGVIEVGNQEIDGANPVFRVSGFNEGVTAGEADFGAKRGTVNVRKGVVQVESNHTGVNLYVDEDVNSRGYIQVDRIIDNKTLEPGDTLYYDTGTKYDSYQVNPAYTSVMHDIKLTTRGGARLSDILPDFINKGIYVVDSNYKESAIGDWTKAGRITFDDGSKTVRIGGTTLSESAHECDEYDCPTSAWLGFVPKPLCPPGYARVITITPAGWAMSQAGQPRNTSHGDDIEQYYYPRNPDLMAEDDPLYPRPLFFQKSTWLKSNVVPYPKGASGIAFRGWHAVMGFVYPYNYFKPYLEATGQAVSGANNNTIVWNVFPVRRRELEGYATVYCYFDRNDTKYNAVYVDKYNQLGSGYRTSEEKEQGYRDRLNDPDGFTKYTTPW